MFNANAALEPQRRVCNFEFYNSRTVKIICCRPKNLPQADANQFGSLQEKETCSSTIPYFSTAHAGGLNYSLNYVIVLCLLTALKCLKQMPSLHIIDLVYLVDLCSTKNPDGLYYTCEGGFSCQLHSALKVLAQEVSLIWDCAGKK